MSDDERLDFCICGDCDSCRETNKDDDGGEQGDEGWSSYQEWEKLISRTIDSAHSHLSHSDYYTNKNHLIAELLRESSDRLEGNPDD